MEEFYIGCVSPGKPTQTEISRITRANCNSMTAFKPRQVLIMTAPPGWVSDPFGMPRARNPKLAHTSSLEAHPSTAQIAELSPAASYLASCVISIFISPRRRTLLISSIVKTRGPKMRDTSYLRAVRRERRVSVSKSISSALG